MNKITAFKNARQFQEIFGVQEHGNGVKSRRNKILLEFYKSKSMWDYCKREEGRFETFFSIRNIAVLKERVLNEICTELQYLARFGAKRMYQVQLIDRIYWSDMYSTDESCGIPSNGDVGFVRYVTHEEKRYGKVYRMRAGRFYKRLLLGCELGKALPEQVLNWLCEQFTESWSSYVVRRLPHYTLHVDNNFKRIYTYGYIDSETYGCTCEFGSCMMDDDQHIFYEDCVKAKAAYLTNDDDEVIARCVIFTDVEDQDGKHWRLAERQYAEDCRDLYKRCLVDALMEANEIDAYKQVGVDCHSTTSYVDKDGNSLMDKKFRIKCELEFSRNSDDAWDSGKNHILSYQDSFKYYDFKKREAYNYEPDDFSTIRMLDTTSCYLEGTWDDYHGYFCSSAYFVWVQGHEMRCDVQSIEDFIFFNGNYIHKEDFVKCPVCGKQMPDTNYYSNFSFMYEFIETHTFVCSDECYEKVKNDYEENVCFYDDIVGHYVDRKTDKPVYLLRFAFGSVKTLKCAASRISDLLSTRFITLVNDEIVSGECVPIFTAGLINPKRRINTYMSDLPIEVYNAALEVIAYNKKNEVEQLYISEILTH